MRISFDRISNFIKYNKHVYSVYYTVFSKLIQLLGKAISMNEKIIFFNSFAGRKYDDSPRVIYEAAIRDARFEEYEFVWAFHNPEKFAPEKPKNGATMRKVCTNSFDYFVTALKAGAWVTNSSVERGLCFKKAKTFYFNTWHGTPIKRMGRDIPGDNGSFRSKGGSKFDVMMSQSSYETEIFSRAFDMPAERFLEAGLPRNDELTTIDDDRVRRIKKELDISDDKEVILYCPTFREFNKDENNAVVMSSPLYAEKWEQELGDRYVVLIRAHYEVTKELNFNNNGIFIDVTDYPSLNELILISDALISDYSSVIIDYSITGKPIILYTYDYEEYAQKRGMYIDIREYFDYGETEQQVIEVLKTISGDDMKRRTIEFREQFVTAYGNATSAAIDCIIDRLSR